MIALRERYIQTIKYPTIIAVLASGVFDTVLLYKSDMQWFNLASVFIYIAAITLLHCFLIAFFAATIWLNSKPAVRNNVVLSLLAWCLLPMGFIFLNIGMDLKRSMSNRIISVQLVSTLITMVPFLISLPYTFYQYRKKDVAELKVRFDYES